jgi:transposase
MIAACPGASNIKGTPTLKEKTCPECGKQLEIFSTDMQVECTCGFIAYNDQISCINWCRFARECIGDEMFELLMNKT